jgi:transcriptional regulator with XRE-family HTH domain
MAKSLGENLSAARVAAGFRTPEDAAIASGLSRNFLYQIERIGNRPNAANPTVEVLEQLCDLYGVALGEMFPSSGSLRSTELQPLIDALSLVDPARREDVVRNLAALVRTMSGVFTSATETLDEPRPYNNRDEEHSLLNKVLRNGIATGHADPSHQSPTGRRKKGSA